mgnify:CR=1 FL=1
MKIKPQKNNTSHHLTLTETHEIASIRTECGSFYEPISITREQDTSHPDFTGKIHFKNNISNLPKYWKSTKNWLKIDQNPFPKECQNYVCENTAKNGEKVRPRSQNVVPRPAPGLQNEALEPPKFIQNPDLDASKGQDVGPQVSEALLEAKFRQNYFKMVSKNIKNMTRN